MGQLDPRLASSARAYRAEAGASSSGSANERAPQESLVQATAAADCRPSLLLGSTPRRRSSTYQHTHKRYTQTTVRMAGTLLQSLSLSLSLSGQRANLAPAARRHHPAQRPPRRRRRCQQCTARHRTSNRNRSLGQRRQPRPIARPRIPKRLRPTRSVLGTNWTLQPLRSNSIGAPAQLQGTS